VAEDFLSAHNTLHLACQAGKMREMAREAWTDERLDDLTARVDEGFNRTEREFQAVRLEMRTEFQAVRGEMKEEFGSTRGEIAALQRTLIQVAFAAAGTLFAGFAAVLAAVLTQG
jgi:hypothetical protein